jgi:hypothetical protein
VSELTEANLHLEQRVKASRQDDLEDIQALKASFAKESQLVLEQKDRRIEGLEKKVTSLEEARRLTE